MVFASSWTHYLAKSSSDWKNLWNHLYILNESIDHLKTLKITNKKPYGVRERNKEAVHLKQSSLLIKTLSNLSPSSAVHFFNSLVSVEQNGFAAPNIRTKHNNSVIIHRSRSQFSTVQRNRLSYVIKSLTFYYVHTHCDVVLIEKHTNCSCRML